MVHKVGISQFQDTDNAYILVSAYRAAAGNFNCNMSFLYDGGEIAAEWEPRWGPIQIWTKASGAREDTQEHYFYEFVLRKPGNWSQLAVEREGLQEAFIDGEYEYIFRVLKRWATRDDDD